MIFQFIDNLLVFILLKFVVNNLALVVLKSNVLIFNYMVQIYFFSSKKTRLKLFPLFTIKFQVQCTLLKNLFSTVDVCIIYFNIRASTLSNYYLFSTVFFLILCTVNSKYMLCLRYSDTCYVLRHKRYNYLLYKYFEIHINLKSQSSSI